MIFVVTNSGRNSVFTVIGQSLQVFRQTCRLRSNISVLCYFQVKNSNKLPILCKVAPLPCQNSATVNKLVIAEKPVNEVEDQKPDTSEQMTTETEKVKEDENVYDEIYFSSGSDDDEDNVGGVSSKSKERRTVKTDDELLYDPNMDDEDEKWVKQQRQEHLQPGDEYFK